MSENPADLTASAPYAMSQATQGWVNPAEMWVSSMVADMRSGILSKQGTSIKKNAMPYVGAETSCQLTRMFVM